MNESFLHYLWQHRLFETKDLFCHDGSKIEILKPGTYNTGAGPDFFNAQLRIGDTIWAGNVEIHIKSSDWQRHNHHSDPAYDSCILHVVHLNDAVTIRMNGSEIHTIEIAGRYASHLWENYIQLMGTHSWIPCQPRLKEIDKATWESLINKMIVERMDNRCNNILIALKGNKDDWQETFYQQLAKNFGFQLNAMPFEMLSRSLPWKIVQKERTKQTTLEALFFGQAGMLEQNLRDEYFQQLKNEYNYLSKKYYLNSIPFSTWKFLRLRPVNFPTVRLAQFTALIHQSPVLFSEIIGAKDLQSILEMFNVTASAYWSTHYQFDIESAWKIKKLGRESVHNILINTCFPFMYSWGRYSGNPDLSDKALEFMSSIAPEDNHVISRWKEIGVEVKNAVESQALLQLKNMHCSEKKCLTCSIGASLINTLP